MKKLILNFFLASILLLTIFSCNTSQQKPVEKNEKLRIVSLAPSITKEIIDLGLKNNIVGATSYCEITKTNKELVIGTATEVNIEKVILLKPDMVLTTALTEPNIIESLRKNGVNVYLVSKMHSFGEICSHFKELGKLVGREAAADSIIAVSVKKIDSLKSIIPAGTQKKKVFFQIGANPIFTVIPNTFMNDLITMSGCENIAYDFTKGTITRESVLQRNPDVIFVVTMGILGEDETKAWQSYKDMSATKNSKIFVVDSDMACTPTVLSFTRTFEQVVKNIFF